MLAVLLAVASSLPAVQAFEDLSPAESQTVDLFQQNTPGVVYITTEVFQLSKNARKMEIQAVPKGEGSGWVYDNEGHIVTNYHVIENASFVTVKFIEGTEVVAKVVGADPYSDVAVLQADLPPNQLKMMQPLTRGNSASLRVGQEVFAIGNPFGLDHTLTKGIVSGVGRTIQSTGGRPIQGAIQTDASINPGNSGGPLLNSRGQVVGMNTIIISPSGASAGIGFAIPSDTVAARVENILKFGYVKRAGLGLYLGQDGLAQRFTGRPGAVVAGLQSNSAAAEGGVKPGDVLREVDGRRIQTVNDIYAVLDSHEPGDIVKVVLVRPDEPQNLGPAPGEGPAEFWSVFESQSFHVGEILRSALPDQVQLEAVQNCLGHVQILARQLLGASVVVQGSYAQGLALRTSDLDLAVIPCAKRRREEEGEVPVEKKQAVRCLQQLATALAEAELEEIRVALRIFTAKVPVLRLHCGARSERTVVVDVSVGGSLLRGACDRGVYAVLQRDRRRTGAALCRLVKLWAKRRKLTNTLRGGLSSFSFVLLTVFFLQRKCALPPVSAAAAALPAKEGACPKPLGLQLVSSEDDLAQLLLEFFSWAVEDLPQLQNQVISVGCGSVHPRPNLRGFKPLVLEVPFSEAENAARCLRIDVWEGVILRELQRAARLARQVASQSGAQRSSALRSLFGAGHREGREGREADAAVPAEPAEPAPEAAEIPMSRKRRRKARKAQMRKAPPGDLKMPEVVAPVDRWLGLRSLLDPSLPDARVTFRELSLQIRLKEVEQQGSG
ncbi:unnamed protein product [Effrenium voratum]|nr:unnamed protein product [Effrenium voratum]